MPALIKLYIRSCLTGFAIAAVFVGLLVYFDIARIGSLVGNSDKGGLALIVLWVLNGIVFAGVQFGIAIMGMAEKDD
jgi:hypothetical protein